MTTDAMALLRTALMAVVAAGAAFLPPPLEVVAPLLAEADEESAVAPLRGRDGRFVRMVTAAATSLPPLDSAAAELVAADNGDFCWMTGTGSNGGLFGFPELRQIAMADLLVSSSGRWSSGSGKWSSGSGRWTTGSGRWSSGSGRWSSGSCRWTTGSGRWGSSLWQKAEAP